MAGATQIDLLARLVDEANPTFTPDVARTILQIDYSEVDHARMADLAAKSNEGLLSDDEREELQSYVLVGDLLSLLQSKARLSLKKHSPAA
jgi:hypothetical protein